MEIYNNKITFPCRANKRPAVEKGETWKTDKSLPIGNHPFVGMRTGQGSYTVVDVDVMKEKHEDTYENGFDVTELHDIKTFTIQTPSGGKHLYFAYDSDVYTSTFVNGYTVDIRNDDGYAIVPPSKGYEIVDPSAPVIDMPAHVKSWIQKDENQKEMKRKKQKKQRQEPKEPPIEQEPQIDDPLSKLLKTRVTTETTSEGITIRSSDGTCFVEDGYKHSSANHSSIFYNTSNKTIVANCFSHKAKKITGGLYNDLMKLLIPKKPQESSITFHDNLQISYLLQLDSYELKKQYFEHYVFMVEHPQLLYVKKNKDDELTYYQNMKYLREAFFEVKDFINDWFKDVDKRRYHKLAFEPNTKDETVYNIFNGFSVDKTIPSYSPNDQMTLIEPIIEHMRVISNYDQKSTDYLLKYLAHIFKYPEKKTNVSLVVRGVQGAGKNAFGDLLEVLLGSNLFFCSSNPCDFFDKHSESSVNKLVCILDEAKGSDTFENSNWLKGLVTAMTKIVNPKNIRAYKVSNYARYIFFSNNLTPVKIEPTDRRFVVFEISDKYANSKQYFDNYYKAISNKQVLRAFYDYLMSLDIKNVDWTNERPITEVYKDMKQVDNHLRFLADSISEICKDKETTLTANEFLRLYHYWREAGHYNDDKMNATKFGVLIKKVDGITKLSYHGCARKYLIEKDKVVQYLETQGLYEEEQKPVNIFAALDKKQKQKENGDLTLKLSI